MDRMYFIGVDTRASSSHRYFPRWAEIVGAPGATLEGLDAPAGASGSQIRSMVERVRDDGASRGALVTTHKVAVYDAAQDLFAEFNDDAQLLSEVGCIVRRSEAALAGIAVDTTSCALPMRDIPTPTDVLIFGAGGAGRAIAVYLQRHRTPRRIVLTDTDSRRREETRRVVEVETYSAADNDRLLRDVATRSVIVNATGLGKDRPGCPLTDAARFPAEAIAWDLNYRGDLRFLTQARAQGITVVDGWTYFISGWAHVMAHVFGREVTPELLDAFTESARR